MNLDIIFNSIFNYMDLVSNIYTIYRKCGMHKSLLPGVTTYLYTSFSIKFVLPTRFLSTSYT